MKTVEYDLDLAGLMTLCPTRLNHIFSQYLAETPSLTLKAAMQYALQNPGKQLRPLLIYATGLIFDAPLSHLDIPASAIELIHTYSLIHDDLPCMDNADLRRGKLTCHKVYGEGMAVLTGDALQTLAMQILANHPADLPTDRRLQMINIVSQACGPYGMAAGQALDIDVLEEETISTDLLCEIYQLKTAALLTACLELGWLSSTDDDDFNRKALRIFGHSVGLAFQIQDDILDIEASTEQLGKPQGLDTTNKKLTYPKRLGLIKAKEKVQSLYEEALQAINYLGNRAHMLRELAQLMLKRQR